MFALNEALKGHKWPGYKVVEGLLGLMRYALDAVRSLGVPLDRVVLVGGGASPAW